MKILWVKPGKILPLDTGGKLRTYNILRHLAATSRADVSLLLRGRTRRSLRAGSPIAHPRNDLCVHKPAQDLKGIRRHLDYFRPDRRTRSLRRQPVRGSSSESNFSRSGFPQRRFDVAVCDFLSSTLNFPRDLATPTALFQHNVESILWKRKAAVEPRFLDRLVFKLESAKMSALRAGTNPPLSSRDRRL